MFEAQRADEIGHVRFANDWIRDATGADPRAVLQIGAAMTAASKAFHQVMGQEGTRGRQLSGGRRGAPRTRVHGRRG